jgi:hypothetical protein
MLSVYAADVTQLLGDPATPNRRELSGCGERHRLIRRQAKRRVVVLGDVIAVDARFIGLRYQSQSLLLLLRQVRSWRRSR